MTKLLTIEEGDELQIDHKALRDRTIDVVDVAVEDIGLTTIVVIGVTADMSEGGAIKGVGSRTDSQVRPLPNEGATHSNTAEVSFSVGETLLEYEIDVDDIEIES